jgi:two-component system cell cycle response regulator
MSGRILIIDSVATHRIVLKVKLTSAQYAVETCATTQDADRLISTNMPDLILMNMSDAKDDRLAYCRKLRARKGGERLVIVGICVADNSRARFAALDAGADDVLPGQVADALMQARIRSLLRRRNVGLEWQMRDETSRVLGFDEERIDYVIPAVVSVITDRHDTGTTFVEMLQGGLNYRVSLLNSAGALGSTASNKTDLFVIDGTFTDRPRASLFQLISDIHARDETRHATKIVVLPKGRHNQAAMLLDLGADDVVFADITAEELALRARALIAHKLKQDRLRDRVRNGLLAAVTDPLTGLYNRRYAQTHLQRIAEQAYASGREYAVMVVDIDYFKAINDDHGHRVGDDILCQLADRLRSNCRAIDLLARIGGEEFLVAMPNTSKNRAHRAAERMRQLVNSTPFQLSDKTAAINVTISVGVAVDDLEGIGAPALDTLFDRADAALYQSKAAGRNMVSISEAAA